MQEIQLDKHVKLLDSPGIVMATGSGDPASVVLRNCIKVNFLKVNPKNSLQPVISS